MRKHERIHVTLPIRLGNRIGVVRNVSESGVYFEIKHEIDFADEINFAIEMSTSVGLMELKCKGIVVRMERKVDRIGIAVCLLSSEFESTDRLIDRSTNHH